MAAVIRLKRRVDVDPLDAFVLNCKRQRTDSGEQGQSDKDNAPASTDETSTVLKFVGTFSEADHIPKHLQQRMGKDEAKEVISRVHRPKIASRNREMSRRNAQNDRFRIVNCTRSLSEVEGIEETTIVDVERDIISAAAASATTAIATTVSSTVSDERTVSAKDASIENENQGYVYDLYVVDNNQPQVHIPFIPDNLEDISVAIYDDPLYSSHRGLGDRSDSMGEESEDSNDENNWRNDYPDEDDDVFGDCQSVDEDDMRRAVEELDLEGDRELSSDDDDAYGACEDGSTGFAYPVNDDVEYFNGDDEDYCDADDAGLDSNDVDKFGTAYARYKSRIMKQMKRIEQEGSEDDNEFEINSGSSDEGTTSTDNDNFDLYD